MWAEVVKVVLGNCSPPHFQLGIRSLALSSSAELIKASSLQLGF